MGPGHISLAPVSDLGYISFTGSGFTVFRDCLVSCSDLVGVLLRDLLVSYSFSLEQSRRWFQGQIVFLLLAFFVLVVSAL